VLGEASAADALALSRPAGGGAAHATVEWPAGAHPHLARLYAACVAERPMERPTAGQVRCCAARGWVC
jgi:hypothetical protein